MMKASNITRAQAIVFLVLFNVGCTSDPADETDTHNADNDTVDGENTDTDAEGTETETSSSEFEDGVSEVFLIDDFDDGDITNESGGAWIAWDDRLNGGESSIEPSSYEDGSFETEGPGYGDTGFAAHVVAATSDVLGWDFVGIEALLDADAFCPTATPTKIDLNSYDGVQFMAKGSISAGTLSFKVYHVKDGPVNACVNGYFDTLTEWADYQIPFQDQLTAEWSLIRIQFADLAQPSWAAASVPLDDVLTHAKSLVWAYEQSGGTADFWIDDVSLFKN